MKLVVNEEKKIATRSGYRTSARTLRKLAESPMVFELGEAGGSSGLSKPGDWDRFQVRNIGLAVQRRMAATNGRDAEEFQSAASKELIDVIGTRADGWRYGEISTFRDFAAALSLVADLRQWSDAEKLALAKVIHAKAGLDESNYLKLMQKHARLRQTIIDLGSH